MAKTVQRSRKPDIRSPPPCPHDSLDDFKSYVKYMVKISGKISIQTPVFSIIVVFYLVAHRDYFDFYTDIYVPTIIATLKP